MSIDFNCPNRIKPKLLREQKTEALLVFIRTTLEQYFELLEGEKQFCEFGVKEDREYIHKELRKLLLDLKECVVDTSYLQSVISNSGRSKFLNMLAQKEKPLMVYYDALSKTIEKNLPNGTKWIPELMVICLLTQWVLEEEKSTYLYPFLNDLDYMDLMERFDRAKLKETEEKKEIVMGMYRLSTVLIDSLKKATFKKHKKKFKRKKAK